MVVDMSAALRLAHALADLSAIDAAEQMFPDRDHTGARQEAEDKAETAVREIAAQD